MANAWKTVRVFVSSTFRDMHAERDYLVRFVFPRLRQQLAKRRINLVEYDLRWGVTADDDALTVCRDIIDECRPRFVCFLGGRYGWIPEGLNRSITADEVLYAAFENQRLEHQFFYFRDPKSTEQMVEKVPGEYREQSGSNTELLLVELKESIKAEGFVPYEYSAEWDEKSERLVGLEEFGNRVFEDLLISIDKELGIEPLVDEDPFDEENSLMDAFVQHRVQNYVLGSRDVILDQVIGFANSKTDLRGLAITGPSGNGKSALLAIIHKFLRTETERIYPLLHIVGASPQSVTVRGMLRRICHELGNEIGIKAELPDDTLQLTALFHSLLIKASQERRIILVIDALNQLSPEDNAHQITWLPSVIPENVRIVVSSTYHKVAESLKKRDDFQFVELQPLERADAEKIIDQFLGRYGKQVDRTQRELLLQKEDSGSPLYLLIALEELRTLGQYDLMTETIRRELPGKTRDLLVWLFDVRLSGDPDFRDEKGNRIGPELVRKFASYLGLSRSGLSSQELVSLVEPQDPRGNVAALERFLSPYCIRRGDLIDFQHQKFNDVVDEIYLLDPDANIELHSELANLFLAAADPEEDQTWKGNDPRVFRELPFHVIKSDRAEVMNSMIKSGFFDVYGELLGDGEALAVTRSIAELYVKNMPRESVLEIAYVYCNIAERAKGATNRLETVIRLGDVDSAEALIQAEPSAPRRALMQLAAIEFLKDSGQLDVAFKWLEYREQINLTISSNTQKRLADSLTNPIVADDPDQSIRPLDPPADQEWASVELSDLDKLSDQNDNLVGKNEYSFGFRFSLDAFPVLVAWGAALLFASSISMYFFTSWDENEFIVSDFTSVQIVSWIFVAILWMSWALGRPFLRRNFSQEVKGLCVGALHSDAMTRRRTCREIGRTYTLLVDYGNKKWQSQPSLSEGDLYIRCLVTQTARECRSGTEFAELVIDVSAKHLRRLILHDLVVELRNRSPEFLNEFKSVFFEYGHRNNHFFGLQLLVNSMGPDVDPNVLVKLLEDIYDKEDANQVRTLLSKVTRVSVARALAQSISDQSYSRSTVERFFNSFRSEFVSYWKRAKRSLSLTIGERLRWAMLFGLPIGISAVLCLPMVPVLAALLIPFLLLVRVRDSYDLLSLDTSQESWAYFQAIDHQLFIRPKYHDLFQARKPTLIASGLVAILAEADNEVFAGPSYSEPKIVRAALRRLCRPDMNGHDDEIVLHLMGQRELLDEFAESASSTSSKTDSGEASIGIGWNQQIQNLLPIRSTGWHCVLTLFGSWISIAIWCITFCLFSSPSVCEYFLERGWIILSIWSTVLVLAQVFFRQNHFIRVLVVFLVAIYMCPAYFGVHHPGVTRWEFYLTLITIFSTHWIAPTLIGQMRGSDLLFPNKSDLRWSRLRAIGLYLFYSLLLAVLLKIIVGYSYSPFWIG